VSETGLEIVGRETDATKVVERMRELRPDVVVLDSADPACDAMLVVMRILRERVGTRVIELNLQDKPCASIMGAAAGQRGGGSGASHRRTRSRLSR